nr:MAG TPA: ATPase [Caudoviricetes sp.]
MLTMTRECVIIRSKERLDKKWQRRKRAVQPKIKSILETFFVPL